MEILRKYFSGQLSSQEEAQVQNWLLEHADDPEVMQALDLIMSEYVGGDDKKTAEAFASVCSRLGLDIRRHRRHVRKIVRWVSRATVCLLLPLLGAAAYGLLVPQEQTQWQEVKIPDGQTGELLLADGTHLHLNAGSRVTYPSEFLSGERRIFVEGEVYAEVAKDEERPFYMASGDVDIKVLGTTFNFKSYDNLDCVELLLLDGSVEMNISSKGRSRQILLNPGEMVQYDRETGDIDLKEFNPFSFRAFHENRSIHFFNLRLSDILSDLERLFGTKLVLLDESLADTRYFALFTNNESLDQILKGIDIDGKMRFVRKGEVIYISKK